MGDMEVGGSLEALVWDSAHTGVHQQASGRRSPESCSKPEKMLKKGTYDKVGHGGSLREVRGGGGEGLGRQPLASRFPPHPTPVHSGLHG